MMRKLDIYIIKKFLGTFVLSVGLIIIICVAFDYSERLDDFIENKAPAKAIIFDYYLNFIPYFANMFSSLFTFISVIFFTSKLAQTTEIVAMLASGISFKRILRPYLISALFIAVISFFLSGYIIPESSKTRLAFYKKYIKDKDKNNDKHIHRQLNPGVYAYMSRYSSRNNRGTKFILDHFENNKLLSRLTAKSIVWNNDKNKWTVYDYRIRTITDTSETMVQGMKLDTTLNMTCAEFSRGSNMKEEMTNPELAEYIEEQLAKGNSKIKDFIVEKHKRSASAFSTIILTVIGMCLSSRKTRGGMGFNIGLGLALSFTYIMFMQVTVVFAINGNFNPFMAAWLPNFIYGIIAIILYVKYSK